MEQQSSPTITFLHDSTYKSSLDGKPLSKGKYKYERSGSNKARLAISSDQHSTDNELLLYLKFSSFYDGKFQTVPYLKGELETEGSFQITYLKAEISSQNGV